MIFWPCQRKKLLVVAGGGAALDFGMPSVNGVHDLLLESAAQYFPLADKPDENLYGFLYEAARAYWSANTKSYLGKTPNFEDVLYAISVLGSTYPARIFAGVLGAFVTPKGRFSRGPSHWQPQAGGRKCIDKS